jgi:hypothetical protein
MKADLDGILGADSAHNTMADKIGPESKAKRGDYKPLMLIIAGCVRHSSPLLPAIASCRQAIGANARIGNPEWRCKTLP